MKMLLLSFLFAANAHAQYGYQEYYANDPNKGFVKEEVDKVLRQSESRVKGTLTSAAYNGQACMIYVQVDPMASMPGRVRNPGHVAVDSPSTQKNQAGYLPVARNAELSLRDDGSLVGVATYPSMFEVKAPVVGNFKIKFSSGKIESVTLFTNEGHEEFTCTANP